MIFSEEMDKAMKFGYKFNILRGYIFQKEIIFNGYIEDIYQIKQAHSKDHPMYLISKLLLNSLYGKFGMNYQFEEIIFISNDEIINLIDKGNFISAIINLNENKSLISYHKNYESDDLLLFGHNYNISISIASAVSAYSRTYMTHFKNNDDYNLYYTDTESIFIDKPLNL
jgi:hypothetical protein